MEAARLLLEKGAAVGAKDGGRRDGARESLREGARGGDAAAAREGREVDAQREDGGTALMCLRGRALVAARLLLEKGGGPQRYACSHRRQIIGLPSAQPHGRGHRVGVRRRERWRRTTAAARAPAREGPGGGREDQGMERRPSWTPAGRGTWRRRGCCSKRARRWTRGPTYGDSAYVRKRANGHVEAARLLLERRGGESEGRGRRHAAQTRAVHERARGGGAAAAREGRGGGREEQERLHVAHDRLLEGAWRRRGCCSRRAPTARCPRPSARCSGRRR